MNAQLDWIRSREATRRSAGLRRTLRARASDDTLLDLASNDYLGLARHPRVIEGAVAAAHTWGVGSTGSRLVTGTTELHELFEQELARFVGTESALVFSSGYLANLGAIAALAGPETLVVSDAQNHASIIDACRLSRAEVVIVPHGDHSRVEDVLRSRSRRRAVVVTDAVFSVDGDAAPLDALVHVTEDQDALLLVDEAHSLGVVGPGGRGAVALWDAVLSPHVVMTATMSKALGSQGGVVLGSREVTAHLVDAARPFIFDTALAPAAVGGALAAMRILLEHPELASRARENARRLRRITDDLGLSGPEPAAAVTSVLIGAPAAAVAAADLCAEFGVRVGCFRPPSVPDGISRLRLTARANLTAAEFDVAEKALAAVAGSR
ncbi:MAG: 8-amino-7-oxononanoate synthase [Candidatus Nanopelagicales bacterium]